MTSQCHTMSIVKYKTMAILVYRNNGDCFNCHRIADNGVIKVADFGLSEEIYTKNYFNQFKESKSVKLPVKWMALESLHYGIFSEKSDVVSFK